jgi:hypothetical protein
MSIDFAALTQAVVAGLSDVRSCLIVSRDGLALGASPATEEGRSLDVWTRIAALGDVERGFVTVRDEVWVFCRRGAYGSVAVADSSSRPGIILDTLEQMVLMAEEARVRKEGLRLPAERETASADTPRGLRTLLHKDRGSGAERSEEPISPEAQEAAVSAWSKRIVGDRSVDVSDSAAAHSMEELEAEAAADRSEPSTLDEPSQLEAPVGTTVELGMAERREEQASDDLVDPAELSREFAGILAEPEENQA